MKYAVGYYPNFRYFFDVDEVIYTLSDEEKLYEMVSEHLPKSTITIEIVRPFENNAIFHYINKIRDDFPDKEIIIRLSFFHSTQEERNIVQAEGYKFMFSEPATKLTEITAMIFEGACEVIVAEDLCFDLKTLQSIRKQGIKIRIYPDIAQTPKGTRNLPPLSRFFIRPEDLPLYENLVDTAELWCKDTHLSVVYEIYKQQQWRGPLNMVVTDLKDIDIENSGIVPFFGQARLNCKKRCTYSKCDICTTITKLAKELEEAEVGLIKTKAPFDKISPEEKERLYNTYIKDKENESETKYSFK